MPVYGLAKDQKIWHRAEKGKAREGGAHWLSASVDGKQGVVFEDVF